MVKRFYSLAPLATRLIVEFRECLNGLKAYRNNQAIWRDSFASATAGSSTPRWIDKHINLISPRSLLLLFFNSAKFLRSIDRWGGRWRRRRRCGGKHSLDGPNHRVADSPQTDDAGQVENRCGGDGFPMLESVFFGTKCLRTVAAVIHGPGWNLMKAYNPISALLACCGVVEIWELVLEKLLWPWNGLWT